MNTTEYTTDQMVNKLWDLLQEQYGHIAKDITIVGDMSNGVDETSIELELDNGQKFYFTVAHYEDE